MADPVNEAVPAAQTTDQSDASRREIGFEVRRQLLAGLSDGRVGEAIVRLSKGVSGIELDQILPDSVTRAIAADLRADQGWRMETWAFGGGSDVQAIDVNEFETMAPKARFSKNECLRKPAKDAYSLRGFLSGIVSSEASVLLSSAFGERVQFKSADVARYRRGDYLRRHCDTFDGRRFGLVWFFSDGWQSRDGGELVIEGPAGDSIVIRPRAGTVAALLFRSEYYHHVSAVRSSEWIRYSVATHFAAYGKP